MKTTGEGSIIPAVAEAGAIAAETGVEARAGVGASAVLAASSKCAQSTGHVVVWCVIMSFRTTSF